MKIFVVKKTWMMKSRSYRGIQGAGPLGNTIKNRVSSYLDTI